MKLGEKVKIPVFEKEKEVKVKEKPKEKPKELQKCAFSGCYDDATQKGTATQKDIDKVDKENRNKHLFKVGTWYYCDKHRKIVEGYCPHLQFEAL